VTESRTATTTTPKVINIIRLDQRDSSRMERTSHAPWE
jgi:hypothetical protein